MVDAEDNDWIEMVCGDEVVSKKSLDDGADVFICYRTGLTSLSYMSDRMASWIREPGVVRTGMESAGFSKN
jgi:hypothetical protein